MKQTMKSMLLWTMIFTMVVGYGNAATYWTCGGNGMTYACGPNGDSVYVLTAINGHWIVGGAGGQTGQIYFEDNYGDIYPLPRRNSTQCNAAYAHPSSFSIFTFDVSCGSYGTTNITHRVDTAGADATGRCYEQVSASAYANDFYEQEFDAGGQSYVGYMMYGQGSLVNVVHNWFSFLETYCNAAYPIQNLDGQYVGCKDRVTGTFPDAPNPLVMSC